MLFLKQKDKQYIIYSLEEHWLKMELKRVVIRNKIQLQTILKNYRSKIYKG